MTASNGWPSPLGTGQLQYGHGVCRSGLVRYSQGIATSSAGAQPNGWKWAFQARAQGGDGLGLGNDGRADHPTRRSRKLARLEAVLLVADGALSFRKLAQFATLADAAEARQLVQELNEMLDRGGAAFRIEKVATGVRMMTRPQFSLWLDRLHNRQAKAKLSPPMLETLSIVAYRQPVTRADIEKIRGVQASEMLRQLMERGLVRITGEDDSLGRPFLYGTTRMFLEEYGFGSLDDLPMADTLRRRDEQAEVAATEEEVEEESSQLLIEDESGDDSDDDTDDAADESNEDSELDEADDAEADEAFEEEEWDEDEEDYIDDDDEDDVEEAA